jgi:hypothetical protein
MLFSVSATISSTTEHHLPLTKQIVMYLVQGIQLKCAVPEID